MSRTVSIGTMIKQIAGLRGTKDCTQWESDFITSVIRFSREGYDTQNLSERQIAVIERIYRKHFA